MFVWLLAWVVGGNNKNVVFKALLLHFTEGKIPSPHHREMN